VLFAIKAALFMKPPRQTCSFLRRRSSGCHAGCHANRQKTTGPRNSNLPSIPVS